MRRPLLIAVPCALLATLALLVACGAFGGRSPTPTDPPPADADTPGPQPSNGNPSVARHVPYPFGRVVVVAIGINRYEKLRGTTDLRFAEADAAEVAEVCERVYGYEAVRLTGERATKREIEGLLKRYARELGAEDALVVFFAGHGQVVPLADGGEAGYFLPADADLDLAITKNSGEWAAQALDMQHLSDLLDGAAARHVVLLADACCSGFVTRRGSLERADLKTFLFDRSRTVLAATTRRQSAREDAAARHGHFTAALLEELRRGEAASVLDLHLPVMRRVAERTNGTMTPQFAQVGDGDGMFVFIPKAIPRAQVEADLNGRTLGDAALPGLSGVAGRQRERAGAMTTEAQAVEAVEAPDYRRSASPEAARKLWEAKAARYQTNAALGDPWAMAALHFCYAKGLGTDKAPDRAFFWAGQADRVARPAGVGKFLLGRCNEFGIGMPRNEVAAMKLYEESSRQGVALAHWAVADRLVTARAGADDLRRARELLERARAAGVGSASLLLAKFHLGILPGVPRDVPEGVRLLEAAAGKGIPAADHALYETFARDRPGFPPKDGDRAKRHLVRAAESGHPFAQQLLAANYYREEPFPPTVELKPDFQLAANWAALAAQQPDDERSAGQAHGLLAHLYERGHGVPKNAERARFHFEEGVRLNCPYAEYYLGFRLLVDDSIFARDFERAFSLAKKSAAQGNARGHYLLGHIYHQWRHPVTGAFGWRQPVDFEYHGWSHHILHNYFQARAKGETHTDVVAYLGAFERWAKFERDRGPEAFLAKAAGNRLPSAVFKKLREEYPDTAKAIERMQQKEQPAADHDRSAPVDFQQRLDREKATDDALRSLGVERGKLPGDPPPSGKKGDGGK